MGGMGGMGPPQGGAPDHIGTVKSVNGAKGYGFVTSPTLIQLYGKDIFFQTKDLMFGPVREGDQVAFSVGNGQKGPTAMNLQPFQPMGAYMNQSMDTMSWGRQQAPPPPMPPNMGPPRGGWGPPPGPASRGPPPQQAPRADTRYFGVVKSVNPEKAWGHISCEAVTQNFGKDAFLRRSEIEAHALDINMQVSFRIEHASKGPQAVEVVPMPDGAFGGVFEGKVKSFNETKGWGFVTSQEVQNIFGKDIFLHKRELNDQIPGEGAAVQFSVEQGPKGQLEARNVLLSQGPVVGVPGSGYSGAKKGGGKARAAPY